MSKISRFLVEFFFVKFKISSFLQNEFTSTKFIEKVLGGLNYKCVAGFVIKTNVCRFLMIFGKNL
jgi:hypothetical protein